MKKTFYKMKWSIGVITSINLKNSTKKHRINHYCLTQNIIWAVGNFLARIINILASILLFL